MKQIILNWPLDIVRMAKNSVCFQISEKSYWMHRNTFNALQKDKTIPTFIIQKDLKTGPMDWIAIPRTL